MSKKPSGSLPTVHSVTPPRPLSFAAITFSSSDGVSSKKTSDPSDNVQFGARPAIQSLLFKVHVFISSVVVAIALAHAAAQSLLVAHA